MKQLDKIVLLDQSFLRETQTVCGFHALNANFWIKIGIRTSPTINFNFDIN